MAIEQVLNNQWIADGGADEDRTRGLLTASQVQPLYPQHLPLFIDNCPPLSGLVQPPGAKNTQIA